MISQIVPCLLICKFKTHVLCRNFSQLCWMRKSQKKEKNISTQFLFFFPISFLFLTQGTMYLKLAWNLQCSWKLPWTLNSSVSTSWRLGLQAWAIIFRLCSVRDQTQGLFHAGSGLYQLSYIPMYLFIQQYITNVTKLLIVGIDKRDVINLCMPRNKNNCYSLIMVIEYNLNILGMK